MSTTTYNAIDARELRSLVVQPHLTARPQIVAPCDWSTRLGQVFVCGNDDCGYWLDFDSEQVEVGDYCAVEFPRHIGYAPVVHSLGDYIDWWSES